MRVTANFEPDILAGFQASQQNLNVALQEMSTGQRAVLPGDDASAAAAMVQNQAQAGALDQYTKNADAALGQAQLADSTLSSVVSLMTRAISLGTEGANGTESTSDLQALAAQVTGIYNNIVSESNTLYQGVPLFGNADESVQVGNGLTVQVAVSKATLFANSAGNVFAALQQLGSALGSNAGTGAIGQATAAVTAALNYVSAQHVVYGNAVDQLNAQETYLGQEKITLGNQQQALVGVDTATAAENLAQAEEQNSAVLAAAAKIQPTTLLDYLSR